MDYSVFDDWSIVGYFEAVGDTGRKRSACASRLTGVIGMLLSYMSDGVFGEGVRLGWCDIVFMVLNHEGDTGLGTARLYFVGMTGGGVLFIVKFIRGARRVGHLWGNLLRGCRLFLWGLVWWRLRVGLYPSG